MGLVGLVLLAALVWQLVSVGEDGGPLLWEKHLADTVETMRGPVLNRLFWAFTLVGNTPLLAALASAVVVLLLLWRKVWEAVFVAVVLVGAQGLSHLVKALVNRPRPPLELALIAQPASPSLPSGHALVTLVFVGVLLVVAWPWLDRRMRRRVRLRRVVNSSALVFAVVVVAAVGFSRVWLGVHWASDVLTGWCLGGLWLCLTVAASKGWLPRPRRN
ncbi:MAG: phosphatase PAP2 family protein, partial [Thermoleophilia bacterium]|nr:phosphatase PAP2 family protein [Thermoleophilia bacterium]